MAATKRMQNRCKKCAYTWYPRGKNLSLKCPSCGSNEVGFVGGGIFLFALIIVGLYVFGGDKHPQSTEVPAISPAPAFASDSSNVGDTGAVTSGVESADSKVATEIVQSDASSPGGSVEANQTANPIETTNAKEDSLSCSVEGHAAETVSAESGKEPNSATKCHANNSVRNDLF